MTVSELVGLNTKYYRHKKGLTQEEFAEMTHFKMAYISLVERGECNITARNIDEIAETLDIPPKYLLDENTALKAKSLPTRVNLINPKN